ncbi:MAG: PilZ domain-containing protein, partial [Phycisphaerales bacterium]|nr:PilZ domain-containing protein [Phycisphaerales bacterium]
MSDAPEFNHEDSIPLCEESDTSVPIIHYSQTVSTSSGEGLRGKRHDTRRHMDNVLVCLSTHDASGRLDHVDCPLIDISNEGLAVYYDRRVTIGSRCFVSYRTISHQPVHVGGVVKNCARIDASKYRIGLLLDRRLQQDELKPSRARPGKSVSPVHHSRKMRSSDGAADPAGAADFG